MDHHHDHQPRDHDHQPHQRSDDHGPHRGLDLDAEVFGDQLGAVLDLTGVSAARAVVDLGAGTGAGSRMLRARFPDAAMTCIDNDPQMLELLREQGFAVLEADLDLGFPALAGSSETEGVAPGAPVNLVWASSSLHHVAHPARLLSGVRRALAPDGVLVVVELATLPLFLVDSSLVDSSPIDSSLGDPSLSDPSGALLEQRCHAAAAAEGWNHYPDWTPAIKAAGFGVTKSELTTDAPVTPAAREYAQEWFARFLRLTSLTEDDRDAVENLLERVPGDLELEPRATRTVWVGTPDRNQAQS